MEKWQTAWKRKIHTSGWYHQNGNMGRWKTCIVVRRRRRWSWCWSRSSRFCSSLVIGTRIRNRSKKKHKQIQNAVIILFFISIMHEYPMAIINSFSHNFMLYVFVFFLKNISFKLNEILRTFYETWNSEIIRFLASFNNMYL